jgi:hypothetical protein
LCDEILESEKLFENIEDLNNEIDKLLEKDILCNLSIIKIDLIISKYSNNKKI